MCNTFAVNFQIFATFGYKKVKNSDILITQESNGILMLWIKNKR